MKRSILYTIIFDIVFSALLWYCWVDGFGNPFSASLLSGADSLAQALLVGGFVVAIFGGLFGSCLMVFTIIGFTVFHPDCKNRKREPEEFYTAGWISLFFGIAQVLVVVLFQPLFI